MTACWCCGDEHEDDDLVRLGCHAEVALCDGCVGWLNEKRSPGRGSRLRRTVPILATGDLERALAHYRALGFETESWEGGGYGFLERDGIELHLGETEGLDPATNTVSLYLFVGDADALHAEWLEAGVDGELVAPTDTDYGLREGRHIDPDGNIVRFGSSLTGVREGAEGLQTLAGDDPLATAVTAAIQAGDVDGLRQLLDDNAGLATVRIGDARQSRTLVHIATDWPGHFPKVGDVIKLLLGAGADVDAPFVGQHAETALHWAASSDDVDALDALLDGGADLEAQGAVLGGGSPLADAVGFGNWKAARRLVERGAATRLKDAAALGLRDRVEAQTETDPPPTQEVLDGALWAACHGGQKPIAEYLVEHGADVNWLGWGDMTALDVAVQEEAGEVVEWLRSNGARPAAELG